MLLRTRITAMVATGLVVSALGLGVAGLLREELLRQRLATSAQAEQAGQWQQMLAAQDRELDQYNDNLSLLPEFAQAAERGDAAGLEAGLARQGLRLGPEQSLQLLAVLGGGRPPLVLGQQIERPLLDGESLERTLIGDAVDGLRLVGGERALIISTRRLLTQREPLVLVLGRDAGLALRQLAEQTGTQATLLDLRGRLLASTDQALWHLAAPRVALRAAAFDELSLNEHEYAVSSLPVRDLAGQIAGTLVTLTDHTPEARASQFLGRLALGGTAVLLLSILLGLHWYLRRNLQPLEKSVDALQALARGDTSVHLPLGDNDEIGRIADAIARFRATAQELLAARALRERVRRRQERLLRARLEQLATATGQPFALEGSASDEEQLRQLTGVMNELSGRLIDQHQRLTDMVQELREALVTKTRLAGLEQELQIAAQVQLSILPHRPPRDARVELHCQIVPAREVGGDFYDYFLIDRDHLGFVIADVSGKGVPAALFMTIARTLLKATAQFIAEPTRCIAQLNRLLAAENEQMLFVTLFYGVLELDSGHLEYVNAGHNPPCLLRAGKEVEPLARTGGMAVAVDEDVSYNSVRIELRPGDQLFLYTDGVTEAFSVDGATYGEARLERALQQLLTLGEPSPASIGTGIVADVHAFERGAPRADDITCMVLRYRGTLT